MSTKAGVLFVRWPDQIDLRNHAQQKGLPRLLVVERGSQPPVCSDPIEDWVRTPISQVDLNARVRALMLRSDSQRLPNLDPAGTLSFGCNAIPISGVQIELMELFIAQFGRVVYRHELLGRLSERVPKPSRNSLDLHIMRLRRRLTPIGLAIRTAWGRGYALELATD